MPADLCLNDWSMSCRANHAPSSPDKTVLIANAHTWAACSGVRIPLNEELIVSVDPDKCRILLSCDCVPDTGATPSSSMRRSPACAHCSASATDVTTPAPPVADDAAAGCPLMCVQTEYVHAAPEVWLPNECSKDRGRQLPRRCILPQQ